LSNGSEVTPFNLRMSASDREKQSIGVVVDRPTWQEVESRIERAFAFGGQVALNVLARNLVGERQIPFMSKPNLAYTNRLGMESLPGRFRLIATTENAEDGRPGLREWWEPGDSPFRGTERFGDDEWDARTVCSDVSVAKVMFRDLFDNGELTETSFARMRHYWNPKGRS
jgi:hypothetical protein